MLLLGLDIGTKRTGIAYGDTTANFVMALNTISHNNAEELAGIIAKIAKEKKIEKLIIGLPRLPGGEEGQQSAITRKTSEAIAKETGLEVVYLDERFTTGNHNDPSVDTDAKAACELLNVFISRSKAIDN